MKLKINFTKDELICLYDDFSVLATKIAPLYEHLNWEWFGKGIPSRRDLYEKFVGLFNSLMSDVNFTKISSGGLYISKKKDEDYYFLEFGFRMYKYFSINDYNKLEE